MSARTTEVAEAPVSQRMYRGLRYLHSFPSLGPPVSPRDPTQQLSFPLERAGDGDFKISIEMVVPYPFFFNSQTKGRIHPITTSQFLRDDRFSHFSSCIRCVSLIMSLDLFLPQVPQLQIR